MISTKGQIILIISITTSLLILGCQSNSDRVSEDNKGEDIKNGEFITKYDNGNVKTISFYVDNKLHGTCYAYHSNGTLYSKQTYLYGKCNGIWTTYNENGEKLFENKYINDVLVESLIYENGKKKSFLKLIDGELIKIKDY